MRSAEKSENKLGTWLPVKKEDGTYVETGIDGKPSRFTIENQPIDVVVNHRILKYIDRTGKHDIHIEGKTDIKFGMIGVTNEYPILDVCLRAGDGPATATFRNVFWKMGHWQHSQLDIAVPQQALDYMIEAVEKARYPQQIIVRFKEKTFYQHPDQELTWDDGMNRIYYLPWIEELRKEVQSDGNVVTTYAPEIAGFQIRSAHSSAFDADNDYRLNVGVTSYVGVYPQERVKENLEAAQARLHEILAGMSTKITALVVIAIIILMLNVLWRYG